MVTLKSSQLTARIDNWGTELQSLRNKDGLEWIWQGDPASWPDHSLLLFPVIGPLEGGVFRHGGKEYPMPPHGFARLSDFSLIEQDENRCVFKLQDSDETRKAYPFAFTMRVEFMLTSNELRQTVAVENQDTQTIPADLGFHPGFNWPMAPDRAKEEYVVLFEKDEPAPIRRGVGDPISLKPEGLPTPVEDRVLRLRDDLFINLPLVFDRLNSRSLVFGAPGSPGVQVSFPDCPCLGLWMIPGARYLAIEPWSGLPREVGFDGPFAEKPRAVLLAPGETQTWRLVLTPKLST